MVAGQQNASVPSTREITGDQRLDVETVRLMLSNERPAAS
jgi:hypothetical protein